MMAETERKEFIQFIRDRGMRLTPERLTLFDEIYRHHGHIDAEELLEAMVENGHKISRATVYRNLDLLVECGLVAKHRLGRNRYLYEHIHPGQGHDHLACSECGRLVEFVSPGIAALQREICRAHGFSPEHSKIQILGLCEGCARAEADGGADQDTHQSAAATATAS